VVRRQTGCLVKPRTAAWQLLKGLGGLR
jgi:hypothetical protein